jgi:energy-converting hydrogenase Eha subunit H
MNGSIVATSQHGFVPFWTLRGSLSTLTSVSQISVVQVEMTLLLLQQTSFLGQVDEQKKQRRASAIEEHKVKIKAMEEQVAFLKAELAQMVAMQDG